MFSYRLLLSGTAELFKQLQKLRCLDKRQNIKWISLSVERTIIKWC